MEKLNQIKDNEHAFNSWSLEEQKQLLELYLIISKKETHIFDLIYDHHGCDSWEAIFRDYDSNYLEDKTIGVEIAINEIVEKINPNATNKLEGKTFVVSGVFEKFSRDELKNSIEDNGGKVGSSISAKTHFVVAGDNMGPAKLEKANSLKIPIISEDDFIEMVK